MTPSEMVAVPIIMSIIACFYESTLLYARGCGCFRRRHISLQRSSTKSSIDVTSCESS